MRSQLVAVAAAVALLFAATADATVSEAGLTGTVISFPINASAVLGCGYPTAVNKTQTWAQVSLSVNSTLALQTSPLSGCGTCLEVGLLCPEGSTTACRPVSILAQVVDSCASCCPSCIKLDEASFQSLGGNQSSGPLAVTYRPVECQPPADTNVTVTVQAYRATEGGWLRLVLSNVAGSTGIASVELRQTPLASGSLDIVASAWRRLNNIYGAAWEVSGIPPPPLDLRITDGAHRQVLARRVLTKAGQVGSFPTSVQFPLASSPAGISAANIAALTDPEASPLVQPSQPESQGSPANTPSFAAAGTDPTSAGGVADGATTTASMQPVANDAAPEAAAAPAEEDVLLPPLVDTNNGTDFSATGMAACTTTILQVLARDKAFSILLALIRTAGMEGLVTDPTMPITFYAPTNNAWRTAVHQFPILRFDHEALSTVLQQHVVVGKKSSEDFTAQETRLDTLSGGWLSVKASEGDRLLVVSQASAGATLGQELPACSSVVHAVNSVLMPQLGRRRMRRY